VRRDGVPRLLLVDVEAAPPVVDLDEDWVRLPADDRDIAARVASLTRRVEPVSNGIPELDDDGVLRLGGRWVALPPVEARLASAMLDRIGTVVSREALARAGWSETWPGRNALDVHILRLRRRLDAVGLAIRTVRSRGYLLEKV
jgi:DNA-binding response OmpR family regulator